MTNKQSKPTFEILRDTKSAEFRDAMSIYNASFPVHERRDEGTIERRVREGFYRMYVGKRGGRVVFLALMHPVGNTEFALLDYMATDPGHRNQKTGESFLRLFTDELRKSERFKYLALEVENPARGENRDQRARRLRFYARCGAKIMQGVKYLMPVKPGYPPEDMVLMVLPEYPGGTMPGALARDIIMRIYREVYGRDENDPLLNTFVNDIPAIVTLI